MNTFLLIISSPDGDIFRGECCKLDVRSTEGELAIMAGHIPFVTALRSGECRVYTEENKIRRANCSGGMLMVSKEYVRVLSSDFKWLDE